MSNIITSEGVDALLEMKKNNKPLPKGWKSDVAAYVRMKENTMNKWMEEYFDACDEYKEAVNKEKLLYGFGKN